MFAEALRRTVQSCWLEAAGFLQATSSNGFQLESALRIQACLHCPACPSPHFDAMDVPGRTVGLGLGRSVAGHGRLLLLCVAVDDCSVRPRGLASPQSDSMPTVMQRNCSVHQPCSYSASQTLSKAPGLSRPACAPFCMVGHRSLYVPANDPGQLA